MEVPYAIERYTAEAHRLYGVMDRRLAERDFLAGDYSIADVACFGWVGRWEWHGIDWANYPNLQRWFETIGAQAGGAAGAQGPAIAWQARRTRSPIRRCAGCRRRSPPPGRRQR